MLRIAFDIGGTFTDFVARDDATGATTVLKLASTPDDPARAVAEGLPALLAKAGADPARITAALHATTVATNAIIQRRGARTALVATRGFRDVLIIGRQKRYETYDMHLQKPPPLIPRRDIFEVTERLGADGEVVEALDEADLAATVERIAAGGYEAVAVALLHAYANPAHERRVAAALKARLPEVALSLSSEVSPRLREYERSSTTAADAYVKPLVAHYLARLQAALAELGVAGPLSVMQSNGGLVSPALAATHPVRIVESGPAAGVLLAGLVGAEVGADRVLSFDMGGTTAKLGAVDDGRPTVAPSFEIDPIRYKKGSGLPISVPAVELVEIGAGGGSLARVEDGAVKVGPESAGAVPGPACYGQGGRHATVTDANLVLGYLDPDYFNGGAMALDADAARAAVEADVGARLGVGVAEAAWGVHLIATANMEHALRVVSLERGRDPRRYAMVAFGGAGPVHAARIARSLGVGRVIVPRGAGVGSAFGLLDAETRLDASVSRILRLDAADPSAVAGIYADLESRIAADLARLARADAPAYRRSAAMRYLGQGFEIPVELPEGRIDAGFLAAAEAAFREAYRRRYGTEDPETPVEAVDWHLAAMLPAAPHPAAPSAAADSAAGTPHGRRQAWFPEAGGFTDTAVWRRDGLTPASRIEGPAIVEDAEATTLLLPGDRATVSTEGHIIVAIDGRSGG